MGRGHLQQRGRLRSSCSSYERLPNVRAVRDEPLHPGWMVLFARMKHLHIVAATTVLPEFTLGWVRREQVVTAELEEVRQGLEYWLLLSALQFSHDKSFL